MKYTLDISGYDRKGNPGIKHFGGLFTTVEDALAHGNDAVENGRFWFEPHILWIRDEEGETTRRQEIK